MTNEQAVALAKEQFVKTAEGALKAALLSSPLAVLETPPLSLVTNEVIQWACEALADNAEMGIFFLFINFNVNQQGADFMNAAYANHIAQQSGTYEEKQITEKNLKDAFSKLAIFST